MTAAADPTHGQWQARQELRSIEALTRGGIRVDRVEPPTDPSDDMLVDLLVNCAAPQSWQPAVELEANERVMVAVPPDYPLRAPGVGTQHRRFARLPHVVWGSGICLYLSPDDWDPGRGMYGFVERLLAWFTQVAEGTIDGPDVPWDPPITASAPADGLLVVRRNLPEELESDPDLWLATAVIELTGSGSFELQRWLPPSTESATIAGAAFLAPVVALPGPVDFSYPTRLGELVTAMERQGMTAEDFEATLAEAIESAAAYRAEPGGSEVPVLPIILLASPAPAHVPDGSRCAHLAAWILDTGRPRAATPQDIVRWLKVYDQRPRVTTRRDGSRPIRWLAGKRVLILGCGGLGAPVAEICARAGASRIALVDNALVTPGILVRQPYMLDDVGMPKAALLADRLSLISTLLRAEYTNQDAVDLVADEFDHLHADLVVDATASPAVAAAIERARWSRRDPCPPILSVMVGHRCDLAAGTLALSRASGGGADVLRRLAVSASDDDTLTDLLDDFHPDPPRTEIFQPEPGCSDATYMGSAADLMSFAAHLLNDAAVVLDAQLDEEIAPTRWATVLRSPTAAGPGAAPQRLHWPADVTVRDPDHPYEIRLDLDALAMMRREVVTMSERRGPAVETGGLLLGQIDHASRVVWVSEAQGPPAGSESSVEGLKLDPAFARAAVADRRSCSRGLVGFIGAWHTHPSGHAGPSVVDQAAMQEMAENSSEAALLLIAGAPADQWQRWIAGECLPAWYARLYFP